MGPLEIGAHCVLQFLTTSTHQEGVVGQEASLESLAAGQLDDEVHGCGVVTLRLSRDLVRQLNLQPGYLLLVNMMISVFTLNMSVSFIMLPVESSELVHFNLKDILQLCPSLTSFLCCTASCSCRIRSSSSRASSCSSLFFSSFSWSWSKLSSYASSCWRRRLWVKLRSFLKNNEKKYRTYRI